MSASTPEHRADAGRWIAAGVVGGCVLLAGLSLLLPITPAFDPWAWLVWGRELTRLELDTTAGPSWKPLPVFMTAILAPLGDAAPQAWLFVARLSGLLAIVLAWRVAADIASRDAGTSRIVAGAGAALTLVLLSDPEPPFARQILQGTSEPLCAALVLGAIDRHLRGRPGAALVLGALAALVRPEAFPLLLAYAVWAWREAPRLRALAASVALAVPVLWVVPDLLGSGDGRTGGDRARVADSPDSVSAAAEAFGDALWGLVVLVPAPAWIGAAIALALALRTPRDRLVIALAAGAGVWMALVCAGALVGYAALPRFAVPAAAVVCVLAGVGAARVAALVPSRVLVALLALVAAAVMLPRALDIRDDVDEALAIGREEDDLRSALERAGGTPVLTACGSPVVRDPLALPAVAWHLDLPLSGVGVSGTPVEPPRVVIARTGVSSVTPAGRGVTTVLARDGRWRVIATGCPDARSGSSEVR